MLMERYSWLIVPVQIHELEFDPQRQHVATNKKQNTSNEKTIPHISH
jgi:hypothetical protein